MLKPRPTTSGLLLLTLLLVSASIPAHGYWLQVRRKGPGAIIAASRAALVNGTQWWRYELDVLDEDPAAGLTIEISRRAIKGGSDVSVRVTNKRGKLLGALAMVKGKLTVRSRGAKAVSDAKALFTPLPTLGVPLAVWAAFELMPAYRIRLEGEFKGTALLRMTPDYTSRHGLQPMKLGISKRNLLPTVVEIVDQKGSPTARLLWMRPKRTGEKTIAQALRIRRMTSKIPLDFKLKSYKSGAKAPTRFGKKALLGP